MDGKDHALAEYKKDVLVIIITCNHCPVAIAYEDRIIDFTKKFGNKADIIAINVNNVEADKLPKMKERAAEKGFNFPYLYDETQAIARNLGATVTPALLRVQQGTQAGLQGRHGRQQQPQHAKTNYLESRSTPLPKARPRPLPPPPLVVAASSTTRSKS